MGAQPWAVCVCPDPLSSLQQSGEGGGHPWGKDHPTVQKPGAGLDSQHWNTALPQGCPALFHYLHSI